MDSVDDLEGPPPGHISPTADSAREGTSQA